jgi:hypothetical protein
MNSSNGESWLSSHILGESGKGECVTQTLETVGGEYVMKKCDFPLGLTHKTFYSCNLEPK